MRKIDYDFPSLFPKSGKTFFLQDREYEFVLSYDLKNG